MVKNSNYRSIFEDRDAFAVKKSLDHTLGSLFSNILKNICTTPCPYISLNIDGYF